MRIVPTVTPAAFTTNYNSWYMSYTVVKETKAFWKIFNFFNFFIITFIIKIFYRYALYVKKY